MNRLGLLADLLVFWAYTTTFSSAREYEEVVSDPITVLARELGNNIPRTKIFKPEVFSKRRMTTMQQSQQTSSSSSSSSSSKAAAVPSPTVVNPIAVTTTTTAAAAVEQIPILLDHNIDTVTSTNVPPGNY